MKVSAKNPSNDFAVSVLQNPEIIILDQQFTIRVGLNNFNRCNNKIYKVKVTKTLMGKHFGDLAFIRGIIYYTLSPHELKPFAGAIKYGIPNFVPRTLARAWTWAPPFLFSIALYNYIEGRYHQKLRKDPRDYVDEAARAGASARA
ncbi:cytochrome b-c1 complex subunit 8-like [Pararge aegeria]|uniref:cytochrome b-c1 complex subunit 8-like n=1 Tax=Pararge aegeria TaxID=116150 RepID=UPI0019D31A41|nr:cytochrome b-c1 complex subunit 8-like [Pararge aegeria]